MRVDSRRLRQLFTNEISASVILVFEKKKWAGTLLRLSFKVLTSKLRIETVPEWIDDAPHPRTVSQTARELLSHFQVPLQCGSAGAVEDITCFDDMEWKTAMLKFASILQNTPLNEVCAPEEDAINYHYFAGPSHSAIAGPPVIMRGTNGFVFASKHISQSCTISIPRNSC